MAKTKSNSYPIQVGTIENMRMHSCDLQILIGGFASKKEAEAYAKEITDFLAEHANAKIERAQ